MWRLGNLRRYLYSAAVGGKFEISLREKGRTFEAFRVSASESTSVHSQGKL